MFGTLIICLPSKHVGGEVRVSHHGEEKLFCTGNSADFGLSWLAWYSNVKHEILPVLSGHRLVLTYNLVAPPTHLAYLSARALSAENGRLPRLLSEWTKYDDDSCDKIIYNLEHQYAEVSLSFGLLKGNDAIRARRLQEACKFTGLGVYLAHCERTAAGPGEEDDYLNETEADVEVMLRRVIDLQGTVTAKNVLDDVKNEFLQRDAWDDRLPDEEDTEGYQGNYGGDTTHTYYDTVICSSLLRHSQCQDMLQNVLSSVPTRKYHEIAKRRITILRGSYQEAKSGRVSSLLLISFN